MTNLLIKLLKVTIIAVAAVALDNQTGVISKFAAHFPVIKDLVLPSISKD
jgi:hypothetical protein